jgi:hypothetical protein
MYERAGTVEDPAEGTHHASVTSHGDNRVKLHSRLFKYVEGPFSESFHFEIVHQPEHVGLHVPVQ